MGKGYFSIDRRTPVVVGPDILPKSVPVRNRRKVAKKEVASWADEVDPDVMAEK